MKKTINLNDIVSTLTHYNLNHVVFPLNTDYDFVYGATRFDEKMIYINKVVSQDEKLKTVIHELVHAYYETRGMIITEKMTKRITNNTYKKYFLRDKK